VADHPHAVLGTHNEVDVILRRRLKVGSADEDAGYFMTQILVLRERRRDRELAFA